MSFTLNSDFSLNPITNPSSKVFLFPNGTNILSPTQIVPSKLSGTL